MKVLFCLFMCLVPVFAQETIPLSNATFDEDLLLEGEWQTSLSGWSVVGTAGVFNPTEVHYPSEDGSRNNVGFTNNGTLVQVTSEMLTADTLYTLSLEVGQRNDMTTQTPVTLRFVAGGEVLAQSGGYSIDPGQWRNASLTLLATGAQPIGQPLEIHLISTETQVHYDNLSLTKGPTNSGGSTGETPYFIETNQTLHVPSAFPTIQSALASIGLQRIAPDVIVTIQVADGIYGDYDTIEVDHLDGKRIQIIGNTSDPSLCVLDFKSGVDGVIVSHNQVLGHIDGFTFQGSNQTGAGLNSNWGAFIGTGPQMIFKDFRNAIYAFGGQISCPGVQAINSHDGIVSYYGSFVYADSAAAQGSLYNGFLAGINGTLLAPNAVATNNGSSGFMAWVDGALRTWDATSQNNLYGFRAGHLSSIYMPGSLMSGNSSFPSLQRTVS